MVKLVDIEHSEGYKDGLEQIIALIYCDTLDELPSPTAFPGKKLVMGSACLIIDKQDVRFLSSEGVWK